MQTMIIELSKYLIILFMLAYTFECFSVFRYVSEEKRRHIYFRQNIWMFLIQTFAYLALMLTVQEASILFFYLTQLAIMILVIVLFRKLYPHSNRLILNNMCMLLSVGFIILTRLSHEKALRQFSIAVLTLMIGFLVPYFFKKVKIFDRMAWIFTAAGILSLSVVLLFSSVINGAKLYVSVLGVTFQPSEFIKLTYAFAIAGLLYQSTELKQVVISAAVAGAHVIILVLSKDLGSAVLYFAVYFAMLYVASKKLRYYLLGFFFGALASVTGYLLFSHVRVRVVAWKDPIATIENAGYQVSQSLFAIGTGGFFGMGIAQGAPRSIPVVDTDFVFAAICEEFGVIFGICIILVCLSCLLMFFNIAMRFHDPFYKILAAGLSVMYGFQVFLTIGGVTKFIPLTGMTLPLISYGGSSLMVSLLLFSLVQGMYVATSRESHEHEKNRECLVITYAFLCTFLCLIGYLFFYTQFMAPGMINNAYNKRQDLFAKKVVRGDILSRDDELLATTKIDESGKEIRTYPYGALFAHAVGFSTHGRTGVENIVNFDLLTSDIYLGEQIKNNLEGVKNPGNNVRTTLDVYVQQVADVSLGDRRGAVVVSNVQTGEILALLSKPDFDPNLITWQWESINNDTASSALLNRATQGLYPPGSTFKIVTALEYMRENPDTAEYGFDCNGSFSYEGNVINCYHGMHHGHVDFQDSFAKSCNSSFANISTKLNRRKFAATCSDLLFLKKIPSPYSYKQSYVPISDSSSRAEVMQVAIGQGKTQITPFHMNLITSAIANDGMLMTPYVISGYYTAYDKELKTTKPTEYGRLLGRSYAKKMQTMMREVVLGGTATRVRDTYGYEASGKTGSAEYAIDKRKSHAWFTGYAGVEEPEIAVTVIVEDGGSGGEVAVPIAKNIFDAYFGKKQVSGSFDAISK
ncbi:MAG: FtsW/RodA/SpoVE family cell cycle protein [Lachnospiraceae bacterium]|nr:FtsW/RodA/SpoVE family cell cycle protein [Lachnospiraceae bacterium]